MKFATRLILAMIAVLCISSAISLYASIRQVQQAYRQTLDDLFQSSFRSVMDIRQADLGAIQARCGRLARSPRIFAALQQNDRDVLAGVADDELREFFANRGQTAVGRRQADSYLFLNAHTEIIAPGTGLPKLDEVVLAEMKRSKFATTDLRQHIIYVAFEQQAFELLCTPIDDVDGEGFLGTLVVIFDYASPSAMPMTRGGELINGLLLGSQMYGGTIPDAQQVAARLIQSLSKEHAEQSAGEEIQKSVAVQMQIQGEEWLTNAYALNEQSPPVYFVVASSLAPLQQAVNQLVFTATTAGVVGIAIGVVVAFIVARGLAKPIAQLSALSIQVGEGNYSERISIRRRDEMGLLGERFNDMCEGLALRDKYRGVLDAVTDHDVAEQLITGALDVSGISAPIAVLFADIRGFTPLTNQLSPQDIVALLNNHMSAMTDIVYKHGGVVDKFVGDMVMAIFGAPLSKPDDAARAARCALEMLNVRRTLNRGLQSPFEIGIGVAYGDMIVGCMGSKKRLNYTVLGERVNLAARLCSMAPAQCVYIDEQVQKHVTQDFNCTELPPLKVKGFDNTVRAFQFKMDQSEPIEMIS